MELPSKTQLVAYITGFSAILGLIISIFQIVEGMFPQYTIEITSILGGIAFLILILNRLLAILNALNTLNSNVDAQTKAIRTYKNFKSGIPESDDDQGN